VITGENVPNSPYEMAKIFAGSSETKDGRILASFFEKALGQKVDPRKTPWCAAFVNSMLRTGGEKGTGSLMARSFLNYGRPVKDPTEGDIVVLKRGNSRVYGHVGFYAGEDENGNIRVLGGNQKDGVNISTYPASKVLGIRRPPSVTQMRVAMR
jgi:uncharacterized protein (TIGR02594 family)